MLWRNSIKTVQTQNRGAYFGACIHITVFAVRIIAEQIPGLSRTLHLDFPDFPEQNSFSRTFQVLEILQIQFQDFPGSVGTLHLAVSIQAGTENKNQSRIQ